MFMIKEKISIIGAGSWGTTLAVLLANKKLNVSICSVFEKDNLAMKKNRENKEFLPKVKFPKSLKVSKTLEDALSSEVIVFAVPVKYARSVLKQIKKYKVNWVKKTFVSVSKGIEVKSLKRVSQIIVQELGKTNIAVLSGPNIAKEVIKLVPSAAIIASSNQRIAKKLQALFTTNTFRLYAHKDVLGVELCGALKNIIAIACGISDGLNFGTNTKSALITRGLVEITRLGKKLGANSETFFGISGLGDLATTCFSPHSRNRTVGEKIGKGNKLKDILSKMSSVAEGVETVKSVYRLSKKLDIDMPITNQVYGVLYKNKSPKKAVSDLMQRPLKKEIIY